MAPRISWSNLLPGIIAITVLTLITIGVLMFAGIGQIRGAKTHLYVLTDQARGVMRGTDVWIAGQKVGTVDGVDFAAPTNDTTRGRVVLAVSVRASQAQQIRRDSRAQVRAGANIIGPVVVYLSSGSPTSPPVREGDTLRARAQSDFELATVKVNDATEQLSPIMTNTRAILGRVHDPNGTVGAVLTEGVGGDVGRLRSQVNRLRARMSEGRASPVKSGISAVMARSRAALARVDSIRTLLSAPGSSYGRFHRDSSLGPRVAHLRDELTRLRSELGELGELDGTISRVKTDSALTRSVADAQREMSLLFADIKRRPLRYVQF